MQSFTVLREPSARYWYTWSPALIRTAEITAYSGNLRLAADLCEWMMGDDRVAAVLDTRCDALLGLPFSIEAQGDKRKSRGVVSALTEDWAYAFPDAELKKLMGWGILLGLGLGQIVWSEAGGRTVPSLRVWSPRWLQWDWDLGSWVLDTGIGGREPITPGDGQWIIYLPSGEGRPWVHGAYRALARWTLLKQYALQDWGYYSERLGQGVWVAETAVAPNVGTGTREQRQQLAADLQALGRNSAIAMNPGQSIKLVESVARQQENFKAQIELADNGTAVAILGQNLTTQAGTGGTIGAASLHGRVLHGRTRMDGKTLPSCLRSQALELWAEYNYGDRNVAPRPWWDTTPIDDLDAKAKVAQMTAQADASLVGAGIISVNEARASRGLPPIKGGDELRGGVAPVSASNTNATSVSDPKRSSVDETPAPSTDEDAENAAE